MANRSASTHVRIRNRRSFAALVKQLSRRAGGVAGLAAMSGIPEQCLFDWLNGYRRAMTCETYERLRDTGAYYQILPRLGRLTRMPEGQHVGAVQPPQGVRAADDVNFFRDLARERDDAGAFLREAEKVVHGAKVGQAMDLVIAQAIRGNLKNRVVGYVSGEQLDKLQRSDAVRLGECLRLRPMRVISAPRHLAAGLSHGERYWVVILPNAEVQNKGDELAPVPVSRPRN